jgi:hypothetical protein
MEWELQRQGFDACYDKRLYDRLAHEDAGAVRAHLRAGLDYQRKLVRFVENHDEPRAATAFSPPARARAAAVVTSTLPGWRLYHDGQFDGLREHVPVFVDRGFDEARDPELRAFYERLLSAAAELRGGWRWCESENPQLLAWAWAAHLVVVNFGDSRAWGRVRVPWTGAVVDGRGRARRPAVGRALRARRRAVGGARALGLPPVPLVGGITAGARACTRGQ